MIPSSLLAGIVFAIGLAIADMTFPGRIVAFFDVSGSWDPTLAFVMAGALAICAPVTRLARSRRPWFSREMHVPDTTQIDAKLIGGAAVFGIGWGLSGFCPGPAVVAAGTGRGETLIFVAAMIAGIAIVRVLAPGPRSRRTDS